jgi:hypothetical protein
VEKYGTAGQAIDDNITRPTRFAYRINKATKTFRICYAYYFSTVIMVSKRAPLLRYTQIASLVISPSHLRLSWFSKSTLSFNLYTILFSRTCLHKAISLHIIVLQHLVQSTNLAAHHYACSPPFPYALLVRPKCSPQRHSRPPLASVRPLV